MAARIAGYNMAEWSGDVPPMANTVEARERAGTDGYTFVLRGKRSPPFQVVTSSLHASLSAARQRAGDYERLIGSFVVVDDPAGRSYGRVMVINAVCHAAPVLHSTDGNHALVQATWTLQRGR